MNAMYEDDCIGNVSYGFFFGRVERSVIPRLPTKSCTLEIFFVGKLFTFLIALLAAYMSLAGDFLYY